MLARTISEAAEAGQVEARYRPVLERGGHRVVGTEALAALPGAVDAAILAPRTELGERPGLLRPVLDRLVARVLADLSHPAALARGWWVSVGFDDGFVAGPAPARELVAAVDDSRLPAGRFVAELSERALGQGLRNGTASRLASAGIQVAVADFGAGWLAPADLRRIPVAYVRVPIRGLSADDPTDVALVGSVVAAARALAIPVLGDGVETDDELHLAHRCEVDLVQGYWWGSPGPAGKLIERWGRNA